MPPLAQPMLSSLRTPDEAAPTMLPYALGDQLSAVTDQPIAHVPTLAPQEKPQAVYAPNPTQQIIDHNSQKLQKLQLQDQPYNYHSHGALRNIAHVLGVAGNIAGNIVAPNVMARIPGTQLNRQTQEQELESGLQDAEKNQAELGQREAQTRNLDIQPQLKMAQQELAHEKQDEVENHHKEQTATQLRAHGFKQDEAGNIVPLAYEEMSPQQQAATDLKNAQQGLAQATEEVRRASNDPSSPTYQLALAKLHEAERGHQAAQMRAQAALMNAFAGNYGTDMQGNALPGAMLDANGNTVGAHFAGNVRPTGQERNKADMAASADQQINDMLSIVQKRPDIFGPAAGRTTDFQVWIGSQDPDAQRFRAARTIAGDHLAGTFGGRSEAALNALDSAIGHFRDNPAAVTAGLNQLKEANKLFLQRGTVHTVGGNNSEPAKGGQMIFARDPQGNLHQAPAGTPLPKGWKEEKR